MLGWKSTIFALVITTLVQSAKRIGMEFLNKILGTLLICKRNNKGLMPILLDRITLSYETYRLYPE